MIPDDLALVFFTLRMALYATLAILPIGIGMGWLLARWRGRSHFWGRTVVETVVSLPLVLPPTAVGLVLLALLGRHGPVGKALARAGIDVLFTPRAVVLATAVMALPLLARSARTAFEEVDARLLDVARTLGHGPLAVFVRVALPLAWRGLLAGTLLAFSRALGEFGATVMVAGNIPGETQTLALAIFQRNELGHDAAAMRLVGITAALAFLGVWATEVVVRRREARR